MSLVNVSPGAASLLGPACAELSIDSKSGAPALAVATVAEWPTALEARPRALLLLARGTDVLPGDIEAAPMPLDVAWLPLQPGELRLRTQRLLKASSLALVGRIAASAAREMGNALSYTCTNIDYVHRAVTLGRERDPEIPMVAEEAQTGIRRALDTCRALLQLSAAPVAEPVRIDVNATIERTVGLLKIAAPRGTRIETQLTTVPDALANESVLMQLIASLVLDASDAGGPGGHVTVRTQHGSDGILLSVISSHGPTFSVLLEEAQGVPEALSRAVTPLQPQLPRRWV